jgi:hypothetical protein
MYAAFPCIESDDDRFTSGAALGNERRRTSGSSATKIRPSAPVIVTTAVANHSALRMCRSVT